MIHADPDPEDLRKFFRALRRARRDLDLRPDRYTHYYKNEFPERFHPQIDTRRWGPGERLVVEPYTRKPTPKPASGSQGTAFSPQAGWATALPKIRCCRWRWAGRVGLGGASQNAFGNPASLRTPLAVWRLTIAAGSTKRRFVIGLYQIS